MDDESEYNNINMDWYSYLTVEFKLNRSIYKVSDRVVVECPICYSTEIVRISNLKARIKRLNGYKCIKCGKNTTAARKAFVKKYGSESPFHNRDIQSKAQKSKSKKTS